MAAAGDVLRQILPEDGAAGELHVLAVDNSHVDRTVVESGSRALQFLGLDGENCSIDFDESSVFREIPMVVMSSENILTRIASPL
ncbi:hypothetical protein TanjilG_21662 [Lupinus angustifolius]|uniref:Uncharacterized protein n=1 Tax=Lupinus angustifolius TaxID=3871 RepID=A0A1J7FNH8_LUPAN|nr:hypothetical protein TanjilG_21662 [Lupinus angustifolius]